MKKIIVSVLIITIFALAAVVQAKDYKFVFWYPGEAGTAEQAQPVLDALFDYLNKKIDGATFSGKYLNTDKAGLSYIKNSKPEFGILSSLAIDQNKSSLTSHSIIARTKPLPLGTTTEEYCIVGFKADWTVPSTLTVYTSLPISDSFFKKHFMTNFSSKVEIKRTDAMLKTLKELSSTNSSQAVALLTPFEKFSIDRMKSDWTKNIRPIQTCQTFPTAPLVFFGSKPEITDKLLTTLKEMNTDPEGKQILKTLRLVGFN